MSASLLQSAFERAFVFAALMLGVSLSPRLASDANAQDAEVCPGGRVASIEVERHPVFDDSAAAFMGPFVDIANFLHVETREGFIRRELLFKEGDCIDPLRMSESERLLRGYSFIQTVNIETTRRADGEVDVHVTTRDDWSLRLEPRVDLGSAVGFFGIVLAERSLFGTGRAIELAYISRDVSNDLGGGFFDPQLFGSRWNLSFSAFNSEPGWAARGIVSYPFLGLVGRKAAFGDAIYVDRWFRFFVGDHEDPIDVLQPFSRRAGQGGAGLRVGKVIQESKISSYGLSLSYDNLDYGIGFFDNPEDSIRAGLTEEEASMGTTATLVPQEILRLNFLVGLRRLDYVKRRRFTTLQGEEDIALGAAADVVVGLAAREFGSVDSHIFGALDLYAGVKPVSEWFSMLRGILEGRRNYADDRWENIFAAAQWTNIWLLGSQTIELTGRFGAGWQTTVPFQLTLGGQHLIEGYTINRFPGGMRAAVRLEDRSNWFRLGSVIDVGTVVFVDAGRMWSNGAAFGTDSGFRSSIGAGLRLAVPPGTRQTYRLDFGFPIDSGFSFSNLVISFSTRSPLRLDVRNIQPQLQRSRDVGLTTTLRHLK